ncbi:MAG: ABC transporter ATP-binding protein [Acidimicrobiales bacterium]
MSGLELVRIARQFAGVQAVQGVSLCIAPGEVVGLMGPNGSGKTTLVNLASGALRPDTGSVVVDGRDLTGRATARFAAAGVIRTFQALRLFEGLSVMDNVLMGAQRGLRPSLLAALFRSPRFRRREMALREAAAAALDDVGMSPFAARPVGALSHGQRRRVELARAFAAKPAYLVLDEPGSGVDPDQLDAVASMIGRQRSAGVGILVVEHDAGLLERVAGRVVGMAGGTVVAEGAFADVAAHPALASHLAVPG